MTRRTVLAAVLLTVLVATGCNNKVWVDCPTTTVTRTKNRALIGVTTGTEPVDRLEARAC